MMSLSKTSYSYHSYHWRIFMELKCIQSLFSKHPVQYNFLGIVDKYSVYNVAVELPVPNMHESEYQITNFIE